MLRRLLYVALTCAYADFVFNLLARYFMIKFRIVETMIEDSRRLGERTLID